MAHRAARITNSATVIILMSTIALALGGASKWRRALAASRPPEIADWRDHAALGHRAGAVEAPVTIIEFGNYSCSFCRDVEPHVSAIRRAYPNTVAFVYRHYEPLPAHPGARAAECAASQEAFWPMHGLLLTRDTLVFDDSPDAMRRLAGEAGVSDLDAFSTCFGAGDPVAAVAADLEAAQAIGLERTPSFIVNGVLHVGFLDSLQLKRIVEGALHRVP